MLTLWYLNPDWNEHNAMNIAMYITNKDNGFITFIINKWNIERLIKDVDKITESLEKLKDKVRANGSYK